VIGVLIALQVNNLNQNNINEKMIFERIRQIVTKTAEANGATAILELSYSGHDPITINNEVLLATMQRSFQSLLVNPIYSHTTKNIL